MGAERNAGSRYCGIETTQRDHCVASMATIVDGKKIAAELLVELQARRKEMKGFLTRRFVAAVLSLLGATFLVFGISQAASDPLLLYAKPGGYGVSTEQVHALLPNEHPYPLSEHLARRIGCHSMQA